MREFSLTACVVVVGCLMLGASNACGVELTAGDRALTFPPPATGKNPQIDTTGTLTTNAAVAFSASATSSIKGAAVAYIWDFGDSNPNSTSTSRTPSHIYTQPGVYTVNVTVTETSNGNVVSTATKHVVANITETVKSGSIKAVFPFGKTNKDRLILRGNLRAPAKGTLSGATIQCDIGGILCGFTLDQRYGAKFTTNANVVSGLAVQSSGSGFFKIFPKHRGEGVQFTDAAFILKLNNASLLPALMDEYVYNRDSDRETVRIGTKLTLSNSGAATTNGNILYSSTITPTFIARKDLTGLLR